MSLKQLDEFLKKSINKYPQLKSNPYIINNEKDIINEIQNINIKSKINLENALDDMMKLLQGIYNYRNNITNLNILKYIDTDLNIDTNLFEKILEILKTAKKYNKFTNEMKGGGSLEEFIDILNKNKIPIIFVLTSFITMIILWCIQKSNDDENGERRRHKVY